MEVHDYRVHAGESAVESAGAVGVDASIAGRVLDEMPASD